MDPVQNGRPGEGTTRDHHEQYDMLPSGVNVLHLQRNLENKTVIDVYY